MAKNPEVRTGMELRMAVAPGTRNGSLLADFSVPPVAGGLPCSPGFWTPGAASVPLLASA